MKVDKDGEKRTTVEGVVLKTDENIDGLIISKEALEHAVQKFNDGHGSAAGVFVDKSESLENVSHVVRKLEMKDDGMYATATVLDTPEGRRLLEALERDPESVEYGISGVIEERAGDLVKRFGVRAVSVRVKK